MSEVDSLKSEKSSKEDQLNDCKAEYKNITEKLERLYVVKDNVSSIHGKISDIEESVDEDSLEQFNDDSENYWAGEKYTWFSTYITDDLHKEYVDYNNKVDDALDSLCDAITILENKKMEKWGLIGSLASAINTLANEIEKFFN